MPRLSRPGRNDPFAPDPLGQTPSRIQYDRITRITAGWNQQDPRWNDLRDLLSAHAADTRKYQANLIRKHADDPKVKPHLLDGEWTGLRMAADLVHREKD